MLSFKVLAGGLKSLHVEAIDWHNRVVSNGGSVSPYTLKAVSDFCRGIDSAGIRDKFVRLNLFCGNGLSSAVVPLFYSTGFGVSRMGDQNTDTLINFISDNYTETGNSGGLTNGGSDTKYIVTGITDSNLLNYTTNQESHISIYLNYLQSNNFVCGSADTCNCVYNYLNLSPPGFFPNEFYWYSDCGSNNSNGTLSNSLSYGLITGSCSSSNLNLYSGATSIVSASTTPYNYGYGLNTIIMGYSDCYFDGDSNIGSEYGVYGDIRSSGYSIGKGLNSSQVSDFNNAMTRFQTALGRN